MSLRNLDRLGIAVALVTCVGLGVQQVAVKLALPQFPGLTQAAIRSAGAIPFVALWLWLREPKAFARDGTLAAGIATGLLFGFEFLLLYLALEFTTSGRAATFLYSSPFFTALGLVLVMPNERLRRLQWAGLALSFTGVALALGVSPATSSRMLAGDLLALGAGFFWACTTLTMKATRIRTIAPTKALLYQLIVSVPVLGGAAILRGEAWPAQVSWLSVGALAYQTIISVVICFSLWFWLIKRYRAGEVSAFTFITPVFGVIAGATILGENVAPGFAAAVALVAVGILLVTYQPKRA
jgi:drug/metabolite transporter (DMT)-like permease